MINRYNSLTGFLIEVHFQANIQLSTVKYVLKNVAIKNMLHNDFVYATLASCLIDVYSAVYGIAKVKVIVIFINQFWPHLD